MITFPDTAVDLASSPLKNLVDSHCHVDDVAFAEDWRAVLQRAVAAGVSKIVVPGYSPLFWQRLQALCAEFPALLYPAYGVHPLYLRECGPDWTERLQVLLDGAVALGEIGLDAGADAPDRAEQEVCLRTQLALARDLHLPVILHARQSLEALLLILRHYPGLRGVVHSFTGSLVQGRRLVDMGFYLGLGAACSHPRVLRLRATMAALPVDNVLVETDAPWQSSLQRRGQRNEPGFLPETIRVLAELRHTPPQELADHCTQNTLSLFRLQDN